MTTIRRNSLELEELGDNIQTVGELRQAYNESITEINFILRSLTLSNLDGEIKTVTIPANDTLQIPHKLRILPKYRIILKQVGGGVIRDLEYTPNYITLENTGTDDATLTIIIVKD